MRGRGRLRLNLDMLGSEMNRSYLYGAGGLSLTGRGSVRLAGALVRRRLSGTFE
jgi:hypothetical protein